MVLQDTFPYSPSGTEACSYVKVRLTLKKGKVDQLSSTIARTFVVERYGRIDEKSTSGTLRRSVKYLHNWRVSPKRKLTKVFTSNSTGRRSKRIILCETKMIQMFYVDELYLNRLYQALLLLINLLYFHCSCSLVCTPKTVCGKVREPMRVM